jgi:hypothetical protein
MASYTSEQLKGKGTPSEAFTSGALRRFIFTNPSSSSYFTFEGVRNSDGLYDSSSIEVTLGSVNNFLRDFSKLQSVEGSFVSSSYIFSIPIPNGLSQFDFTPSQNLSVSSSFLRGTGEFSLVII